MCVFVFERVCLFIAQFLLCFVLLLTGGEMMLVLMMMRIKMKKYTSNNIDSQVCVEGGGVVSPRGIRQRECGSGGGGGAVEKCILYVSEMFAP